jgi:hydrogenase 3 maturation protease
MKEFTDQLLSLVGDRVCIVGVGNRLKADDAAGPMVIDQIAHSIDAACIDAGVAPENILEKIVHSSPSTVLIVDALDFRSTPGDIRLFDIHRIKDHNAISTHAISLQMLGDYLDNRTTAAIFLIGIQPQSMELGKEPTEPVLDAIDRLSVILLQTIGKQTASFDLRC